MNAKLQHPAPDTGGNDRTLSQANGNGSSRPEPPASKPAIVALPRVKPGQPAADLIRTALRGAMARLEAADPEARRGEVEGIHRLRTSTRRLRSELQTVRDLVERDWREHLEQELKWLAGTLGSVRDLDILCHRLRSAIEPAAGQNGTAAGSVESLPERRARASLPRPAGAACPELAGPPRGPPGRALPEPALDAGSVDRRPRSQGRGVGALPDCASPAGRGGLAPAQEAAAATSSPTHPTPTFTRSASPPSAPATPPS